MFGDPFFTRNDYKYGICQFCRVFVPMFGDSFFTSSLQLQAEIPSSCFRPHVWGFFFHLTGQKSSTLTGGSFRPHVWGFFFHMMVWEIERGIRENEFSSPCLGILFSLNNDVADSARFAKEFSSPCLGILFSQQAWGAPRDGLSMALLRRGFPIDWNSHYFHPLTYCFLRFHAYRRGFLLL